MTDHELLQSYARERSEASFRELVRRHIDLVHSAAVRQTWSRSDLAEDVTQLVFVELARKAGRLRDHPCLRGWLYTCTHHLAARTMRSELRRRAREQESFQMTATGEESAPDWPRIRQVLDESMHELKQADRDALLLRYFDRRSLAEVGKSLGVTEDAARRRVDRSLERIRRIMERRGIRSTGAALAAVISADAVHAAPAGLAAGVSNAALAAGGSVTASFFSLMSTLKTIVALAGTIAVAGAIHYGAGWRAAESLADSRRDRLAAARARLHTLEQAAKLAARPSFAGGAASAAGSGTAASDPIDQQIARDLALGRWERQRMYAGFQLIFAPHLRARGVPETVIQGIIGGALQMAAKMSDLDETAKLAGTTVKDDPELAAQAQAITSQWFNALQGVLGTDGLADLRQFYRQTERTGEALSVANQVSGMSFASSPLSPAQKSDLVAVIAGNCSSYQKGGSVDPSTVDWDAVIAQAGSRLSADQLAALKAVHADWETDQLVDQAASASAP